MKTRTINILMFFQTVITMLRLPFELVTNVLQNTEQGIAIFTLKYALHGMEDIQEKSNGNSR